MLRGGRFLPDTGLEVIRSVELRTGAPLSIGGSGKTAHFRRGEITWRCGGQTGVGGA